MAYNRIIPRDLFNEASLLKCYGKLYIELEKIGLGDIMVHDGEPFNIVLNEDTGGLILQNIQLQLPMDHHLERPINSRDAWPLFLETKEDTCAVFTENGEFTLGFLLILK